MKFVFYARKSSEGEERQAKSIEDQINIMKEIAKRDNVDITQIFQESKSAKEPGRPVFNEMIKQFEKGKFEGILCWKIDRLARNPKDEGTIKWMLQKGIIQIIKTNDRDYLPDDNSLIASVEFGMATQYVKDLSKNVRRGLDEKVKRGEYAGCPPVGYYTDHKTRMLTLDQERSPYIENAFRLYATGKYSVMSLSDKLYDDGLRSNTGKKVHHSAIHKIIKNPIYYGYFNWKGQLHKGVHEAIISKDLFDEAQRILEPKKHSKRDNKKHFLFRGFMHCICGLRMTAEFKIKKNKKKIHNYIYYRCTKSRGADHCSQKYIQEEELTEEIYESLSKIRFDERVLDLAISATQERAQKEWGFQQDIKNKNAFMLERNKTRQNSLVEKYIENKIPEEIYDRMLTELRDEQATLENKVENTKGENRNIFEIIALMAKFIKLANKVFKDGTNEIKKEVLSIISSNLIVENKKIACLELKEPFNWLYKDIKNFKTPKGGNSIFEPLLKLSQKEKGAFAPLHPDLLGRRDSNPYNVA
jgi:site-specific DNA recombinase